MEYVQLGKSGLKVSKVILGTMTFGDPSRSMSWTLPEAQALPILKRAFDLGINTWDTADTYSNGDSERIIGKALREYCIPRERVVLLSKCYAGLPEDMENLDEEEILKRTTVNDGVMVNRVGLSRKHIFDAVDASIARLGTYIDVLQIHRLDRETPREEIMKALNDVVASGKARYIGACSMAAWEFQALQNIAKQNGWHQFISMQDYYSLLYRENEREMIPYCQYTGIGIIPFSPLARGLLTRPYGSQLTTRQKADIYSEFLLGETTSADIEIIGRVEELARQKGVSMATVAVAWCVAKGVIPIVGLGSIDRVNQTVEGLAQTKTGLLAEDDINFLEQKYVAKPITVVI
ncbi:aldo-keto reductase-like protein [Hyaloscypha bicolor E]|uniref:Aldo-keto reductase-like protein n=1 Tax=Hyaloscypha bicolor E TaxID=1095630 RepID=A0A2J6SQ57_9HELO|nr:aldo-keto reductase-like protein [Hyaloscypha bicolor E]PMD52873.1 aldo-keto reductase-like protein [Hyaloscypha bicolor E]